jgi:hypothetical protein
MARDKNKQGTQSSAITGNGKVMAQLTAETQSENERLEQAAARAIEMCGGDLRSAVRALILANEFLEHELELNVSSGYLRGIRHGRFKTYAG